MPYCTSCGSSIPDGQGESCSMCYGDMEYGRDGYYRAEFERAAREEEHNNAMDALRENNEPDDEERAAQAKGEAK